MHFPDKCLDKQFPRRGLSVIRTKCPPPTTVYLITMTMETVMRMVSFWDCSSSFTFLVCWLIDTITESNWWLSGFTCLKIATTKMSIHYFQNVYKLLTLAMDSEYFTFNKLNKLNCSQSFSGLNQRLYMNILFNDYIFTEMSHKEDKRCILFWIVIYCMFT